MNYLYSLTNWLIRVLLRWIWGLFSRHGYVDHLEEKASIYWVLGKLQFFSNPYIYFHFIEKAQLEGKGQLSESVEIVTVHLHTKGWIERHWGERGHTPRWIFNSKRKITPHSLVITEAFFSILTKIWFSSSFVQWKRSKLYRTAFCRIIKFQTPRSQCNY